MKKIKILLGSNWKEENSIFYRGNKRIADINNYFENTNIEKVHGSFALIKNNDNQLTLLVDSIRSIPVFYKVTEKVIYVSDNAEKIAEECHLSLDTDRINELRSCGYVLGNKTLYKDIYQLLPCEILSINKMDGSVNTQKWHKYPRVTEYKSYVNIEKKVRELDSVFKAVISDTIKRIGQRQIVVPLSGGLDSRTLAYYLKELGVEDVICISYGRKTSFEVTISKQVARKLGYRWLFCEYDANRWREFYRSQYYKEYLSYAGHGSEIACYQAFPAIHWLLHNRMINDNAVVLPGHTLDFIAGSHYPELGEENSWSHNEFHTFIMEKHFLLNKNTVSNISLDSILTTTSKIETSLDIINSIFEFELNNRQGKFIANDVRTYDFFGMGYELPFWDIRLVDFFVSLPYELLYDRKLHRELMNHKIDAMTGIETPIAESVNNSRAFTLKKKLKRVIPFVLNRRKYNYLVNNQFKNPNAFYDHYTKEEYHKMIKKFGLGFNIDTMVAEAYTQLLQR